MPSCPGRVSSKEGDLLERVPGSGEAGAGCGGGGWGGGIPARSSRVTEVPAPPPSPLTCPLRVTQAAGKRCPYLGADLVRQLPDATPPSCPSQAGTGPAASHILRWDAGSGSPHESELGGGQTAFPGVISHLQGFS